MAIYCDRLSSFVFLRALGGGRRAKEGSRVVQVLDYEPKPGLQAFWRAALRLFGFRVEEARFESEKLRRADGSAPMPTAREILTPYQFACADRLIGSSQFLRRLNAQWGRETLRAHLVKMVYFPALYAAQRILCADALAHRDKDGAAEIFIGLEPFLAPGYAWPLATSGARVITYRHPGTAIRCGLKTLSQALRMLAGLTLRRFVARKDPRLPESPTGLPQPGQPSLLLLQEDDLSMERSCRGQPHWLFEEDGPFPGQIIVLRGGELDLLAHDPVRLAASNVRQLDVSALISIAQPSPSIALATLLRKAMLSCLVRVGLSGPILAQPLLALGQIFQAAGLLCVFCQEFTVRAFMTCENFYQHADALNLFAEELGIATFSYQYSNIRASCSAVMLTTADVMFTFSPLYHSRWICDGVRPGRFIDVGYIYDASFPLVQQAASRHRERLRAAGATFIICYFDENPHDRKYSHLISKTHWEELRPLLEELLADKTLGLVMKPQFNHNLAKPEDLSELMERVKASGRYLELTSPGYRCSVLPAEAALGADIAMGDLAGGTAILEAALAGVRSIYLNPRNVKSVDGELYARADVVYPGIVEALAAIRRFRAGDERYAGLGDWISIIDAFDPYRDGRAARRMREELERAMRAGGSEGEKA